ncbi:chromosome partitioning protein ParA [Xanthomonas oryzae pv. oryzae]|nr:chromosome partitioning protein ParA [Xanthomonas oryzae pv. oryzae]
MAGPLRSAIYTGWVRHRRFMPRALQFRYRLFLMYVDLSELDQVFARRWLWSVGRANLAQFRRSDYLGDANMPLDQAVRDCVQAHTGERPEGAIRLLTHLRYFGHVFNPVSFYYCFDRHDALRWIVAEITNTPWQQRHTYVLPVAQARTHRDVHAWRFDKRFHVSPFMGMQHRYHWRFSVPDAQLRVHMDVLDAIGDDAGGAIDNRGTRRFDATLVLQRQPITGRTLARTLLAYPLMTVWVVIAIHWQALRLWLRGNPVHDHPHPPVREPR